MDELALYKFVKDNNIEFNLHNDECWVVINIYDIEEFNKLLPNHLYDEEGLACIMKDGYFCFEMSEICESCDIEPERVFSKS